MANEPNVQRILEYLRIHGKQYDLATLRQQLSAAGYAAEDLDAAVERYENEALNRVIEPVEVPQTPVTEATIVLPETARPPVQPEVGTSVAPSPVAPPPDREAVIGRILSYLTQNQNDYDLDALRRQVLASGYPPELVAEAFTRLERTASRAQPQSFGRAWGAGCGIWALNFVVSLVLFFIGVSIDSSSVVPGILAVIMPLLLLGELIGGFVLRSQGRPGLGNALLWGVLYTVVVVPIIGFALGAIIFGICLVLVGGFSL
jgi:hypothetical protein